MKEATQTLCLYCGDCAFLSRPSFIFTAVPGKGDGGVFGREAGSTLHRCLCITGLMYGHRQPLSPMDNADSPVHSKNTTGPIMHLDDVFHYTLPCNRSLFSWAVQGFLKTSRLDSCEIEPISRHCIAVHILAAVNAGNPVSLSGLQPVRRVSPHICPRPRATAIR